MIVQTKNGIMLHGEIAKDPVLRDAGQKRVLKFDLKASRTQDETGKWQSFFVGVNLWHGIDQWDGMLQKGDQVTVFAQKLKEREYNGKVYYDVDADDVQPGGLVTFRWLQQMIDLMAQPGPPPEPAEPAANPADLQGAQIPLSPTAEDVSQKRFKALYAGQLKVHGSQTRSMCSSWQAIR